MKGIISMDDYDYALPDERIAQTAAEPRDSSALLLYEKGRISDHVFRELPDILPARASLFLNDAKVIPARIFLANANGARIEVFLLKPFGTNHVSALGERQSTVWECMTGNSRKWKTGEILKGKAGDTEVQVERAGENRIRFSWNDGRPFALLLEDLGRMPLPPYITHEAGAHDAERYQTVYAKTEGSVAAPTAGLHFTEDVMRDLESKGIPMHTLTLHVSAGTFLPVKAEDARQHPMHLEIYSVTAEKIKALRDAGFRVAVGTTSCRVMESLYWAAARLYSGEPAPFSIPQFAYEDTGFDAKPEDAMDMLLRYLEQNGLSDISGDTSLMIVPGYRFRLTGGLITNFHQPRSTLLLLISAFTGNGWRDIYRHALDRGYRFLSYGDSSLLLP